ncbi:DUF72 domain-containing protein [Shouchella shacheensis]|uniref:DUF72 domain-containing protein n=1 Tax=Shouchella shacheensis TaxID=1649580 RepID=UPI00074031A0|nr:DUF72 domain-containing protein [Shouchella shacheensis]
MISIGLTGWGDHDSLYESAGSSEKLQTYAGHFPIVELDSSFYAVQPLSNMRKWVRETPASFQFIVKAYQGMTGHQRGEPTFETKEEMFTVFKESLKPLIEAGKLAMVLCQFPPWFDLQKNHVQAVRYVREQLKGFPCALEFRHQSWFSPQFKERTLQYMREDNWIHSVCDEPQAGAGSVPTVLEPTCVEKTLVRFHGRNVHGWSGPRNGENWREVRYLYQYNKLELEEWKEKIAYLNERSKHIYVVFNNNSGGHAAGNARQFIEMLGIEYTDLAPRQLDLF